MYAADNADTSQPELYINKNASQTPFTASLKSANGWTYLPSGILMQWGYQTVSTSGNTITFVKPFTTSCFSVQLTVNTSSSYNYFVMADTVNATSFKGYATTRSGGSATNFLTPVYLSGSSGNINTSQGGGGTKNTWKDLLDEPNISQQTDKNWRSKRKRQPPNRLGDFVEDDK